MAATAISYATSPTSLTIHNLPFTADEDELQELFPAARNVRMVRNQSHPSSSQLSCVLQFGSPGDCHKAFAEFQGGKELGGRILHAVLGDGAVTTGQFKSQSEQQQSGNNYYGHRQDQQESYSSGTKPYNDRPKPFREGSAPQGRYQDRGRCSDDSVLVVSNLPYSATEKDLEREFRDACNITLNRDDRGRSSGVAELSFPTREQCNAALHACNNKTLNGRTLRGRIASRQGLDNSGNGQRNYENRSNRGRGDSGNIQRSHDYRPGQGRSEGAQAPRSFDNRPSQQTNYNNNRREFDDGRRPGGGAWRGGRGRGDGGRDFNRGRSDRFQRRERSPAQGEPIRGYAASKGFRITSAVISGGDSPSSSSSSDHN